MEEYTSFIQENLLIVGGLLVVVFLIIKTEISRLTRKYKQLNVNEAVQLMNRDETVVVDVRDVKEVSQSRGLNGAKHIPLGSLAQRMSELNKHKDQPILVYCRSGNRSSHACEQLTKNGFEDVSNLSGGIMAWESANLPMTKL